MPVRGIGPRSRGRPRGRIPTRNPKATDFTGFKKIIRERIEEAVSTTAAHVEFLAREAAPVRKIFKGSRRSVRQLTGVELKAERTSRINLGLPTTGPISVERERKRFFGGRPSLSDPNAPRAGGGRAAPLGAAGAKYRPSNPSLRSIGKRSPINTLSPHLPTLHPIEGQNLRAIFTLGERSFLKAGKEAEDQLTGRGRYEVEHALARRSISYYGGKPIVGGALRDSIKIGPLMSEGPRIKQSVSAHIHYAKYVEFGTRHAAGQPFLRPALAKVREEYRKRVTRAVYQSLRKNLNIKTPTGLGR